MGVLQRHPISGCEACERSRTGDIPEINTIAVEAEGSCHHVPHKLQGVLAKFINWYIKIFIMQGTTMEFCYSGTSTRIETFKDTLVPVIQRASSDDRVFPPGHIVYKPKTWPNGKVLPLNFEPMEVQIRTQDATEPLITASLIAERASGGWDGTMGDLAYQVMGDYHVLKTFSGCPVHIFLKELKSGRFELHYISMSLDYFRKWGKSSSLTKVVFFAILLLLQLLLLLLLLPTLFTMRDVLYNS